MRVTTGVAGLLRRAGRRAADRAIGALNVVERDLLFWEANALVEPRVEVLKRNQHFRAAHKGRRAFVLGNGPSLAKQDLRLLDGEITFAVNAFWKHPIVETWNPTYVTITDGQMFEDDPAVDDFFSAMRQRLPHSTFFFELRGEQIAARHSFHDANFIALNGFLHRHGKGFDFNPCKVLPSASTVVQTSLLLAIWMGCDPIYLIGCDHNWLDNFGHDEHFYSGKTAEHVPDAQSNVYRTDYYLATEYITEMWRGYEYIRDFANGHNIRIVNATQGGRLDVFETVSFESLFEELADGAQP